MPKGEEISGNSFASKTGYSPVGSQWCCLLLTVTPLGESAFLLPTSFSHRRERVKSATGTLLPHLESWVTLHKSARLLYFCALADWPIAAHVCVQGTRKTEAEPVTTAVEKVLIQGK